MKNNVLGEIIISLLLIGLLVFFLNPIGLLMPQQMHPLMIPLLVILFIIFAAFIWKEQPGDERAQLHKFIASRFAYFAGLATLLIAILVEHATQTIDPWLVIVLCVILLAKIAGILYSYWKH
ncbi:MAG: hypothetical protein ACREHC_04165 [Candidatus Levyibacteriota bacterium]